MIYRIEEVQIEINERLTKNKFQQGVKCVSMHFTPTICCNKQINL